MGFVYEDEDNEPIYWVDFEHCIEAREAAREMRKSQIREGFLDDLGFLRDSKCRKCPWMLEGVIEAFEDQADDHLSMPGDAYDLAQRMCKVCKTTPASEREDALDEFFRKEDAR